MARRNVLALTLLSLAGAAAVAAAVLPGVLPGSLGVRTAQAGGRIEDDVESRRRLRRTPVVEAVEKAAPSVVSIGTTQLVPYRYFDWDFLGERRANREMKGLGSGVIVHPSGLVVTNAHVINQADQVVVRLTGLDKDAPELPATIVAADAAHDLALLRINKPGPYPAATIGRSDDLMAGETIIAIGSPFGFGRTVSTGIVSALDRTIGVRDRQFTGLIQTDAAINQGNSGGPLLNILGEWVGVNSAIYSLSGGADGISFAIPMETVNRFVQRTVQSGRAFGTWLGMSMDDDPSGAVHATMVYPVGPAAEAGLTKDAEITEIDGRPIRGLGAATLAIIDAQPRGKLEIAWTDTGSKKVRTATVTFAEPPTGALAWQRLGIRASEVTPQVREQTGYPVGSGIVVTEVRADGPASRVGLAQGDLLLAVGEQPLTTSEDLLDFVQWTPKREIVPITLVRPERSRAGTRVVRFNAKMTVE